MGEVAGQDAGQGRLDGWRLGQVLVKWCEIGDLIVCGIGLDIFCYFQTI